MACQKFMGCDYSIRWCKRTCNSSKKKLKDTRVKSLFERALKALGEKSHNQDSEGKKRFKNIQTNH